MYKSYRNLLFSFVLLALMLAGGSTQAAASNTAVSPPTTPIGLTDPDELEAFLDDYLAGQMADHHIPGVAVSFVKDGEIFLSKGYGMADLASQTPYDPEQTLFTAASIAKVMTAVSILQLAEQGRIDLHEDVTPYLGAVRLPQSYDQPLTFHHLLTHTDGFEARMIGIAARTEADLLPLADLLNMYMPTQLYAPGEYMTYGNFATNLAGHLAAEVTARPFEQLIADSIFAPLGMRSSTLEQRLSAEMAARWATGYEYVHGEHVADPFFYIRHTPEGGLRTTTQDMSQFMLALLSGGANGNGRILSQESVNLMFTPQFRPQPQMSGISYGLFEHLENGHQLFLRDGDGLGTRSRLVLFPAENLGFFISYNSGESALRLDLVSAILDRYYPDASLAQSPGLSPTAADLRRFVGSYRPLQADVTTFGKSMYFFAQQVEITAKDGFLYLTTTGMGGEESSPMGGFEGTSQWAAVAPLQFEQVDGKGQIAFAEDEGGVITRLYSGQGYHSAFGKLAGYESQGFQIALVALAAVLILSGVAQAFVVWPVSLGVNKLRGRGKGVVWTETAVWLWTAVVSGMLALVILRAVGVLYAIGSVANLPNFAWGVSDEMVRALNAASMLALLALLTLPVLTLLAWVRGWGKAGGRVHLTLVTLAALALVWWAWYWNLLGA
jgi:CubicO group peptidase (beta-lactamase class C family)